MPDPQAALRDLEAIRIARWRYLKEIGDPASRTFLYADLETGKYDGHPQLSGNTGELPRELEPEIVCNGPIAPEGFDYVKAFEAYWPSRPR